MRSLTRAIVAILLLCFIGLGCGESEPASVPFKKTDTGQFDQLKDQMSKNLKTKNYVDRTAK